MNASLTILPDLPEPGAPVGVIAGSGRLPVVVAEGLRKLGHRVHGLGIGNQQDAAFVERCDSFRPVGLLRVATWPRFLRREGVRHAIMVGRIDKANVMHDPWRLVRNLPDARTLWVWYTRLRHDRRSYAVLGAIADELDRQGVSLMDSTLPIPEHMSIAGVMGTVQPTRSQLADVQFSWPMLAELLRLDIGQSLAVRERDILAVEAVEGTDRMIERVGVVCRARGWTLCKGARAGHDRRSDVPTVGVQTIERLAEHGAGCLAVAAGDVIMLDRDEMVARADALGIAVIGVPVSHGAAAMRTAREPLAEPGMESPARTSGNDHAFSPSVLPAFVPASAGSFARSLRRDPR